MDSLRLSGMSSHSAKEGICFHLLNQQSHRRLSPLTDPWVNPETSDLAPLVRLVPATVLHWQRHQGTFPGYLHLNMPAWVKEAEPTQHYGTTNNCVYRLRGDQNPAWWYHALIGIADSTEICFYTQLIPMEIFLHQMKGRLPIKFTFT